MTDPLELLDLVVAERRQEAAGVVSLTLRHPEGLPLPSWEPGAHLDLVLADGLERQYSLCGDQDPTAYRIAVLLQEAGRGGSARVHAELHPGVRVRARGPRNHFRLESAPAYRFVAGGIGITPILPMLGAVGEGVPWTLLYGGRERDTMAFTGELTDRHPGDRTRLVQGTLDLPAYLDGLRPGELVYACGPAPLLAAVEALVPPDQLRLERFTPTPTAAAADRADDSAFEIELARSGRVLTVPPDCSILRTLQEAGLDVLYSCAEGTCGTCETEVLEGAVDHRDSVLSVQERASGETMMICVSRALGPRLTLDL